MKFSLTGQEKCDLSMQVTAQKGDRMGRLDYI
jgi:hypothetical protein